MKVLVSGATGFIGKHLVRRLRADGHEVWAIVRPSSDTSSLAGLGATPHLFDGDVEALAAFLKEQGIDGVFHLASLFLAGHKPGDIRGLVESNVLFSTQLLEATALAGTSWFINTGTFWQHYQNADYSPVNLYAATKQAFEDIARYYLETTPISFATLQLSDTFGPEDTRSKVLNLWMKTALSQETLEMSPGQQQLDISFVGNVVDAFVRLAELLAGPEAPYLRGRAFAVSSGRSMPLRELARVFEQVTGKLLPIVWGGRPYRPREVMFTWSRGETVPGWQPRVSLEDGIKQTFHGND